MAYTALPVLAGDCITFFSLNDACSRDCAKDFVDKEPTFSTGRIISINTISLLAYFAVILGILTA